MLVGCGGGTTSAPSTVTKTVYGSSTTAQATPQAATPSYKVVVTTTSERPLDGKPSYYVVINPVDLSNDSFKQNVKLVLQALAKTNGSPDFTAYVYDDEAVANTAYSLNAADPFHKSTDQEGQHTVAMYLGGIDDGKVSTANSAYQIIWYPATYADTPNVSKYTSFEHGWKP